MPRHFTEAVPNEGLRWPAPRRGWFHECLHLDHYLQGRSDIQAVLEGVKTVSPVFHIATLKGRQYQVPAELDWFLEKGFKKEPAERYASVEEMTGELQRIIRGECRVHCKRTFVKRMLGEMGKFTDERPVLLIVGGSAVLSLFLAAVVKSVLVFM